MNKDYSEITVHIKKKMNVLNHALNMNCWQSAQLSAVSLKNDFIELEQLINGKINEENKAKFY